MEGYGYSYQNYDTYKSNENNGSAIRRPFVPFVPNSNRDPEGYVTRKTVIPVATRPYGDDYYNTRGSPTKGHSIRDDDDYLQKQKVDDFLVHVHNEGSRSPALGSPVRNDNYYRQSGGGYGNYDTYNDKGRRGPNDSYDRYHHQPADTYSSFEPHRNSANGWSRTTPGWTPPPRNGTQLSEPTSDIGKALGLLKEAAKGSPTGSGDYRGRPKDESYYGSDRPNPSIWAEPPGNGGSHHNREPGKVNKAMELAKEAERLRSLKNKLLGEPTKQHKDEYYYREPVDHADAARRRDDQRYYGSNNINSWQAQKKHNGASF
ncbi:hypothetical protein QN277_014181 [Acacia crassicarpa]|uniref:Uncharacterized protein n=1 Tax=Acacia crassicarpa TaxID=499986 RepID=A0AAE1N5A5_9FABA|nr:hypothetical protein QN277_014181 [Acacia crassicarpa]